MSDTEELRDDILRVINNFPTLTIVEVVGTLEMVKEQMWDRLRACEHPDAQKP